MIYEAINIVPETMLFVFINPCTCHQPSWRFNADANKGHAFGSRGTLAMP